MSKVLLRLLRNTHKKNLITDSDKYIWCPMKSGVFAKSNYFKQMGCDGRNFFDIIRYVYATDRLADINFDVDKMKPWAQIMANFGDNDWWIRDFQQYVETKYKKYMKGFPSQKITDLTPGEYWCLDVFHRNSIIYDLIFNLMAFGEIKTAPKFDNNYIYFRSVRTTELDTAHSEKYVVKKSAHKTFFWLDVGTWSSPQSRKDENGSAMVGIMTPDEVALFDIYASKKEMSKCLKRRPVKGTMATNIGNTLKKLFGGGLVYYYDLTNHKNIKTPVSNDEVVFVIPDLHLHLFREYSADNFIEPWKNGRSLDGLVRSVFTVADHYSSQYKVNVIQVGDLYELWESAMLLLMALKPDWTSIFKSVGTARALGIPVDSKKLVNYLLRIQKDARDRGYDKIFSKSEIDNLSKLKWDDGKLKDVWKKMQHQIERRYPLMFQAKKTGRFDPDMNQVIIAGNHDSFLENPYTHELGVNNAVRLEHLHYNDEFNKPENMAAGQFMTALNLLAETLGLGDQAKALETSRRAQFAKDVAGINWGRHKAGKKPYELIITGHTHRAYAGIIRMKQSKTELSYSVDTKYEHHWQKERTTKQTTNVLGLAMANRSALLGGISALRWRGLGSVIRLALGANQESKPFK